MDVCTRNELSLTLPTPPRGPSNLKLQAQQTDSEGLSHRRPTPGLWPELERENGPHSPAAETPVWKRNHAYKLSL